MTMWQIAASSLRFHWRIHAAVALGVAAATAVLSGALLVGDSVRGSLRHLTLDRLGQIDDALVADRFFRRQLADDLAAHPRIISLKAKVAPAIMFPSASAEHRTAAGRRLAAGVQVVGAETSFWELGESAVRPREFPRPGEVILNAPLAQELGVAAGDSVNIRFGKADQIPADSPLGRRTDRLAALAELKVIEVLPAEGLGRFGLDPSAISPKSAFVALADVQGALDVAGKINAIFVGGLSKAERRKQESLSDCLAPRLEDIGLAVNHVRMTFGEGDKAETIYEYFNLTSERMLLDQAAMNVAWAAFAQDGPQPVFTYLANKIEKVSDDESRLPAEQRRVIPYSTISALGVAHGGPFSGQAYEPFLLGDDEIVLTSWAAEDLQAKVGDQLRMTFFEPETTHGDERESTAEFRVVRIVPLTEPKTGFTRQGPAIYGERPTIFNDSNLTPEVKGITDQASIADWDAPFPFDYKLIRPQDDTYWDNHRTTPKAYISLAKAEKLWGSRFGSVTSIRIPAAQDLTKEKLAQQLLDEARRQGVRLGLEFMPVRQQGLAASAGTTPFDVLFLILSMFVIGAALVLIWLLFRLGVDQRADEIGLLLALGWSRAKTRWLLLGEAALVAVVGAGLGTALGVGYAWLMLVGLRTWWAAASASPFLTLYVTPLSAAIGFLAGIVVSVFTIWFSLAAIKRAVVRSLLAGEIVGTAERGVRSAEFRRKHNSALRTPRSAIAAGALFIVAIVLAFCAAQIGGEARAGAFLGAGAAMLVSLLLITRIWLSRAGNRSTLQSGGAISQLAYRNAGRNVGRSIATISLVASAAFLIVAVSAFRMNPTSEGVGGFDLIAESSQPIYADLNSEAGRRELLADQANVLAGGTVLALRLKPGDDASCRNLYQPMQPRILGVSPAMIAYFDNPQLADKFAWSASAAKSAEEQANPWRLLSASAPRESPINVVMDQNTAMYSLRLYGGVGEKFEIDDSGGRKIPLRVAGLLAGSVLQGNLLIGEADFLRLFPQVSGYRYFLIRPPVGKIMEAAATLEERLGDEGFDVVDARARLADLLAVQNTYISTFQALGALGLVLGTFGLAAMQLRSVLERRKELALLRATGFRRSRLGEMVLMENLLLLVGGLVLGAVAALVAVLPHMLLGGARVPVVDLGVMLGVVLIVGVVTGLFAVRATLRAPLVAALRGK